MSDFKYQRSKPKPKKQKPEAPRKTKSARKRELKNLAKGKKPVRKKQKGGGKPKPKVVVNIKVTNQDDKLLAQLLEGAEQIPEDPEAQHEETQPLTLAQLLKNTRATGAKDGAQ
jgi:hypothetical protein